MKKYLNVFFVVFFSSFLFNYTLRAETYIVNPDYDEYNKLTEEEKSELEVIPNEYIRYYTSVPSALLRQRNLFTNISSLPSSYDLRNVNSVRYLPSIKNQGSLGLCWAFASNSTLESYFLLKNKGSYNFSENQPDYVARYLKDTATFGAGNSLFNVVKYWMKGYTPVNESYFGSYFTTQKSKSVNSYMNTDNTAIDVNEVKVFPSLDVKRLFNEYSLSVAKEVMSSYNSTIKNHIIENGALTSVVYWDFYNSSNNMVYNNGSKDWSTYSSSGHAITIIGWDDDYGSVTINGNKLKGAWLAMNSWGNDTPYFYISYYDMDVVSAFVGIKNAGVKSWTNSYFNYLDYSNNFNSNSKIFNYYKGSEREKLESVKIFFQGSSNPTFRVTVSDGIKSYTSDDEFTVSYGINTYKFNNAYLSGENIKVTVENGYNQLFDIGVFTKEESSAKNLYQLEDSKNNFTNEVNNKLTYHLITKNMNVEENYNVSIIDAKGNNISSQFKITKNKILDNYATFNIILNSKINSEYFEVITSIGSLTDRTKYIISTYDGKGTISDPYVITKPEDLLLLKGSSAYFELGNNINMEVSTNTYYGMFNEKQNGWEPINFSGHLDGKNYKIINLHSKNGGLFNVLSNASVKNITLENFDITNDSEKYNEIGALANNISKDSEVSILTCRNCKIKSRTNAGIIFGIVSGGNINNIKIYGQVYGKTMAGGISSYINLSNYDVDISNIYLDNSSIYSDKNNSAMLGIISPIIYYNAEVTNELPKLKINNNRFMVKNMNNNNLYDNATEYIVHIITNVTNNNVVISDYDLEEHNLLQESNNEIINSRFDSNSFTEFSNNIWSFDQTNSLYITNHKYAVNQVDPELSLSNNGYVYITGIKTTSSDLIAMIDKNIDLEYNIYNKIGKKLENSDLITTGSFIEVKNKNISNFYEVIIYGDTSGDGKINIQDVLLSADYSISNTTRKKELIPTNSQFRASDIDNNGKINIADVLKIADYSLRPSLGF